MNISSGSTHNKFMKYAQRKATGHVFIGNFMNTRIIFIALVMVLSSCEKQEYEQADTIYINGSIITIDDQNPTSETVATRNGLIHSLGSNKDIQKLKGAKTKVVDLKSKTMVPGFIDAHSHFAGVGTQAIVANLLPAPDGLVNNIKDLQKELRNFLKHSSIAKDYNVVMGLTMMILNLMKGVTLIVTI